MPQNGTHFSLVFFYKVFEMNDKTKVQTDLQVVYFPVDLPTYLSTLCLKSPGVTLKPSTLSYTERK